ncbi:MAG: NUDIX domain-containing protein [Xenococcus sp. MO_188.B8]|nr:NUDIX domain-containing protein [Xenococcus sp. MO_188.B8]
MTVHSAGILVYRYKNNDLQVLLVHPGGPFWSGKDLGAWSIPKGIFDDSEQPLDAAKREFLEETGFVVEGEFMELGELRQPSKKIIHAWSIEGNFDLSQLKSNTFKMAEIEGSCHQVQPVVKTRFFTLFMSLIDKKYKS